MFTEKKRTKLFGLPLYFTTYQITDEKINISRGLLTRVEDDCFTYKVQDVKLVRSLLERIFGLGTVVCYTSDATDQVLELVQIRHSQEVKDFIIEKSEEARTKKRTVHTLDLDSIPTDDE